MKRSSGILLHVSSLPSDHGIGDFGPWAYRWIDFLAASKQRYWQILPLNPIGYGNSPYSSYSAFAGNWLYISLDELAADGLLNKEEIARYPNDPGRVCYDQARKFKHEHLLKAYARFKDSAEHKLSYEKCCDENFWLSSYAEYAAERERCEPEYICFQQYLFDRQWAKLKTYANSKNVKIIGDLPMYVSADSAETKVTPDLFDLETGYVAGVPPCSVYPAGQMWGNPLYEWDYHFDEDFDWWMLRLKNLLRQADVVRLDYFCGYVAFWATNGKQGHWREGPAAHLFERTRSELGDLPFLAEDLGVLTPEINHLRDSFGISSTKVMQYAFDGMPDNPYIPENFANSNCVVYTGTHDNDTTRGWFESLPPDTRENVTRCTRSDGNDISWDLIKLAAHSCADLMIIPMQDALCLGRQARLNTPGTVNDHNWSWRMRPEQAGTPVSDGLSWVATTSNRLAL